jgi:hypothetical protein
LTAQDNFYVYGFRLAGRKGICCYKVVGNGGVMPSRSDSPKEHYEEKEG